MSEKVIVLSGPSGSGKTTLAKKLLEKKSTLSFSVSATTRPARKNETNGKDYYFVNLHNFDQNISENKFIEYEEVYPGIKYGTLWSEISRINQAGQTPLLDIDVYGAISIKKEFNQNALLVFIHPGSTETLKKRLKARNSESEKSYNTRINKALEELKFVDHFDKIIYNNDTLDKSFNELNKVVNAFLQNN